MTSPDLFKDFPLKRLKAVDGMAVTAETWEEAHQHTRQQQRFHALFGHGPGIVTGLEVVASDPPDNTLYIEPGLAIDPQGQTIVLAQPTAYNVGPTKGPLYLVLTYGESEQRAADAANGAPSYIQTEFMLQASATFNSSAGIELARLNRSDARIPIRDAKDPAHPGYDEIDLRFRRTVGAAAPLQALIAVSYLGGLTDVRHGRGLSQLARTFTRERRSAWVDDNLPLTANLEPYTLLCLTAAAAFQLGADETQHLRAFVQGGGTLFLESCRHEVAGSGAAPAENAFLSIAAALGLRLEEVRPGHPLLSTPHLFMQPPAGFETGGAPRLLVGEGLIYSPNDYGCLWQGEQGGGPAPREAIRAAAEWGENLLTYALAHKKLSA